MHKYIAHVGSALLLTALFGCGMAAKMIAAKTLNERNGIFTEVSSTEPVPAGYADVLITAEIKTRGKGDRQGEPESSAQEKETYPYLFNIDGQAVIWTVEGKEHELPKYDPEGRMSRDPEAGMGIKYVLKKEIRLRAGTHRFFFGLPEDDYCREFTVALKNGETHVLEFKPHYWHTHIPMRIPTFLKGVTFYDILFDSVVLRS